MKYTSLLFLLIANFISANAQRVEMGLQAGVSNYWGDLAPKVKLEETHPAIGVFFRLNLNHTWALKAEFNHMRVSGTDAHFEQNKLRNLSFFSPVTEGNFLVEFNYTKYGPFVLHEKFTSYLYTGIGGFVFNPQAVLDGKTYELRDYQTENVVYNRFSMSVPFGIGVKWMASKKFAIEGQLGFRKTFTDYLDDVSTVYPDVDARFTDGGKISATLSDRSIELYGTPQFSQGYKRGSEEYKDWFMCATIAVSMRLHTKVKCARFY